MEASVLDKLDTAVIRLNAAGHPVEMNGAAETCLGTSSDRIVGQEPGSLEGIPDVVVAAIAQTRADHRSRHLLECPFPGGLYDATIQLIAGQEVLLELYSLRWEQQRYQLQQRELQTGMLGLLRKNLSHEIRNPLGGIRGAAQMIAEELEADELGTLARLIIREVDRINELIQSFGETQLQHTSLDIHQVADEAIELLMAESGQEFRIVRDFDPSIPDVPGDASAIRQVLLNLVLNASQSGARTIHFRTRIEHGQTLLLPGHKALLRVDVEDDGDGVPEHLRAMLFLPLVTGRREGSGLGLALSQQIAAAHNGLLSYEAMQPGSRFSLRLPLTAAGVE